MLKMKLVMITSLTIICNGSCMRTAKGGRPTLFNDVTASSTKKRLNSLLKVEENQIYYFSTLAQYFLPQTTSLLLNLGYLMAIFRDQNTFKLSITKPHELLFTLQSELALTYRMLAKIGICSFCQNFPTKCSCCEII